jgi:hypothetical protein
MSLDGVIASFEACSSSFFDLVRIFKGLRIDPGDGSKFFSQER